MLALMALGQQPAQQATQEASAAEQIPDSPRPQVGLPSVNSIRPGMGTTPTGSGTPTAQDDQEKAPPSSLPATQKPSQAEPADEGPAPEMGNDAFKLVVRSNFVEVPFTLKDKS